MNTQNILKAASIAVGSVLLGASPAFAQAPQIPEPSVLSLYGGGVAALVIAARWMRRK